MKNEELGGCKLQDDAVRCISDWGKESFMKATGKGMALPADAFCIRLGDPPVLTRQPEEFPEQYYYIEFKIKGLPYRMAVCSTDQEIDGRLHTELKL